MSSLFTTAPDRANSVLFSALASPRSCVVFLGTPETGQDRLQEFLRSLTIEHVSVSDLVRIECQRPTPLGAAAERATRNGLPVPDDVLTAVVRKWFWSRRAGRGFSLVGFPTNLAQALLLDEWLDAKHQSLDEVVLLPQEGFDPGPLATHYEQQVILKRWQTDDLDRLIPGQSTLEALSA